MEEKPVAKAVKEIFVDVNSVLRAVQNQRNNLLDENAVLAGRNYDLEREVEALKKRVEELSKPS